MINNLLRRSLDVLRLCHTRTLAYAWRQLLTAQAAATRTRLRRCNTLTIAHPVRVNGGGDIYLADRVVLGDRFASGTRDPILLQARGRGTNLAIEENTWVMNGTQIIACESVHIGARTLIGPEVLIYDSDFHGLGVDQRTSPGCVDPVRIGNDVWIGTRATILRGVQVGDGAIVGTGAVVTHDVEPMTIVAGNPARVIGSVPE